MLTSPMQLAVMTARLASGMAVEPHMIIPRQGRQVSKNSVPALNLPPEHLNIIRTGMFEVCNHERGTAYGSRIADSSRQIAGKTGTSQVFSITAAERAAGIRAQTDLPWNRRDHALFVAYAPYHAPRVSVTVVVEHGGGGSTIAAPIARDIVLFALHGGIPPAEDYPVSQRNRIRQDFSRLSQYLLPPHPEHRTISRT